MVGADSIVISYIPILQGLYKPISCQEYIFELALVFVLNLLSSSRIILRPSHTTALREAL